MNKTKEFWSKKVSALIVGDRVGSKHRLITDDYSICERLWARGTIIRPIHSKFDANEDPFKPPTYGYAIQWDNGKVSDMINPVWLWRIIKVELNWKNLWGLLVKDDPSIKWKG